MPNWIPGAGVLALVGMLYLFKAVVVRHVPGVSAAVLWFAPLLALAVPMTWATNHDWNSLHFYPVMHWVGDPVAVLVVPTASFAADLWSRQVHGRPRSAWWYVPEVFIALPLWMYGWILISFYILGWGWI